MQGIQGRGQVETKWVEVKTAENIPLPTPETYTEEYREDNNLYIEYRGLNMTVGSGYPVESLISLLREMCAVC